MTALRFKAGFRYFTKEPTPRSVRIDRQHPADPDVYLCYPEGMRTSVVMNCGSKFDGRIIGTEIYLDDTTGQPA